MKLGFFTMPIHPVDKDWRLSLKEDREAFLLADELGFTEAYVGEHITDRAENITSSIAFIAWLAAATKQIKLGTGTVNMPNAHPAAVAASIAMLDHMLDGRLIFGISPGGLLSDAEVFGNLEADRNAMFLEAINQVLQIWASEPPYNLQGQFWNISVQKTLIEDIGQGFIPRPLQRPHPPIVVTAVAPFSKGVTEAAARGWEPISANFLMPAWVKSHWPKYVEGCERAGRPADVANWRVAKSVFVAKDAATAKAYATDPNGPYVYYYRSLFTKLKRSGRIELFKTRRDQPDDEVTLESICDKLIIHGTPESVADQLLAFQEETGPFGTLLYAGKDWKDRELGRQSMILMAENVMPRINANASGAAKACRIIHSHQETLACGRSVHEELFAICSDKPAEAAAREQQGLLPIIGVGFDGAEEDDVIAAVIAIGRPALEAGHAIGQHRRVAESRRPAHTGELVIRRFCKLRGQRLLGRPENIDREVAGILKGLKSLGEHPEAPQHQRRVERHRGKGIAGHAIGPAVRRHCRDDGDARGKCPQRVAKIARIDRRIVAGELIGRIGRMFGCVGHPASLRASDFRTAGRARRVRSWFPPHRN